MRKMYPSFLFVWLLLLVSTGALAQNYSETEPNNSFATANKLLTSDTLLASVGGADAVDYFKPDIHFWAQYGYRTASLYFYVTATNTGTTPARLRLNLYNGLQAAGLVLTDSSVNIAAGATQVVRFQYCGQYVDDFYLAVSSTGSFDYKLKWYFSDPNTDTEPNDTRATAAFFPIDTFNTNRQAVGYQYRQNIYTDTADWFKTFFPPANYANLGWEIKAKNNSCASGQGIQYAVYRNQQTTPLFSGYVGNNPNVSMYNEVASRVPLSGMSDGDTLFVKIWSQAAFGYEMKYASNDVPFEEEYDDQDPDGYEAETLAAGQTIAAQLGYHIYENGDPVYDEYGYPMIDYADSYQITLPQDGVITLYVKTQSEACGYGSLNFSLQDSYGNDISGGGGELVSFDGNCGPTSLVKVVRAITAGTYRIRLDNGYSSEDERISYTLMYQFQSYTSGGSDDPEYNNSTSYALPISAEESKKGYLHFISPDYSYDYADYYKTTLPAEATLKVYVKATYRGDGAVPQAANGNRLTFGVPAVYFSRNIPGGSPFAALEPDAAFTDTFTVAGVPAGVVYLTMGASDAWEYEFRYEIVDTLSGPSDVEPNNTLATAQPVAAGDTTYARIGYKVNGTTDSYDHFRAVLPSDGTLKIYVEAKNTGSTGGQGFDWLQLTVDDGRTWGNYSKYIANNQNIALGQTVYDTITLCGIAKDTLVFRFYAQQKFQYNFRYELVDTVTNYLEPNNTFATAVRIGGAQTVQSTLNYGTRDVYDGLDYYKIPFGSNDVLKMKVEATNKGCAEGNITVKVFNQRKAEIFSKVLSGSYYIATGDTITDSISVPVNAPDTLYVRFQSSQPFLYSATTGLLLPYSAFTLTGDSTVCLGQQVYKAVGVEEAGVTYQWSLPDGGGTLTFTDSIATVTWTATGTRRVQLSLANAAGSTSARQLAVTVNSGAPTQVPVVYNFARTLSTTDLPPGATVQWFKNGAAISGATAPTYYAADAGAFTAKFVNDCGDGPASNTISFPAAAQPQTITLPPTGSLTMTPGLRQPLAATTSSGLPVFYQVVEGNATVVNDTLYITRTGQVVVRAYQPGDDRYAPAADAFDTITVVKGTQTIMFDSLPAQLYSAERITLGAKASSGLGIVYSIVSGPAAFANSNQIYTTGAGIVTVRASQPGDVNYKAAAPVERSFCVGVRTLNAITGDANPCPATYRYTTQKIPGANFVWSLSGGGVLTTHNDTAWVQWQTPGAHTLRVKANADCDTVFTDEQTFTVNVSNNAPTPVSGMQPANLATGQKLPLTLSWLPGANTVSYDVYIWEAGTTEPSTPFVSNLTTVSYVVPKNALAYNKTYQWRVVSKNPCTQAAGPVQQFSVIPLPDLVVSDVHAPLTANAGETITITWKVTNVGPGKTFTSDYWQDGVYLSLDTTPNFRFSLDWNPFNWSALTAQGRPLLVGKKERPVALDVGESYTNSINFTLPLQYDFPVYVYVITNNQNPNYPILQASVANDTARMKEPVAIHLSPTPDLRVDSVFTTATAFSGSTINVTYKVKNYGVLTPDGVGWTDSVFISQKPLFDRGSSIPLTLPKADGSYYPNAVNAHVSNNAQLLPDATVTRSVDVVIPNFIFGTWFIYVKTNANTKTALYEGAANENNLGQRQLQVILTPTPKLTVNTLTVQSATASTTQPFAVNWNVHNDGFRDNIEKARGHYFTMGSCPVPCTHSCPPGSSCACAASAIKKDSVVFGSSYWVDKVYLSTDGSGLNTATARLLTEVQHGTKYSGIYNPIITCPANYFNNLNVSNVIAPNADFPKSANMALPADLAPGTYYIYVQTNAGKDVFEYPGTPQIRRSETAITISRPDLVVSSMAAPANSVGGQTISIDYAVTNNGQGTVFNYPRKDQLYISNFNAFDGSAKLVTTQSFTESLPVGSAVPHSFAYKLPAAATGAKYFYVVTNYDSTFRETNMTNNLSAAAGTNVSAAVPSDLLVSAIDLPDTVFTIFNNSLRYTVQNSGTGTTAGTWTDSLYVSCNPVFNPATSYFVGSRKQTRGIAAGESYTDTLSFALPKMTWDLLSCFPQTAAATAYFFLKANADSGTYEASSGSNNVLSVKKTFANPVVDHTITSVAASAATVLVGRPLGVQWTVKNVGYRPPYYYYNGYYDAVYLSADTVWNAFDPVAASFLKYTMLNRNDSTNESRQVTVPNLPTGEYYLFVKTNTTNGISGEVNLANNLALLRNNDGTPKAIHIVRPLLPDLVDSILSAPASVAAGQPITVIRRTTNTGVGVTYPGAWENSLWLSADFSVSNSDRLLAQKTTNGALQPGEFRDDTLTVTIPMGTVAGNYVLISDADSRQKMVEVNEENNAGFHLLTVFEPPVVDLLVQTVNHPDTVYLGDSINTIKWWLRNASTNTVQGWLTDAAYLSASGRFDSTAVLLGTSQRYLRILPLESDSAALTPLLTGVTEGAYNLFVKTDLLNNFAESDKDNNTSPPGKALYVKVRELPLGVATTAPMQQNGRYYKLIVPDSLLGSTLLVTLKTPDSLTVQNELYIGGGYVPSPAKHDYKYEIPHYGNQQIVITSVTDSAYYIFVRSVSPHPPLQSITLQAVKLPFAVLNVQSPRGGNSGNVTVKISGSLFETGMTAQLQNGGNTITAAKVYFLNSTQVFATFNLQGKPLGVYDVVLKKGDTANAVLPGGFAVVPTDNGGLITGSAPNTGSGNGAEPGCDPGASSGLNSQLVVEMVVPPRVTVRMPLVITINYRNPTNVDIPAQTRTLFSEKVKLALTKAGVANGTTALYLEFTEPGGPPGIIRAGAGGTILVHTVAPSIVPADPVETFKLK